jgi:hypothetical protein
MPSNRILLTDGKPQILPTDDTSAVRIRALDKADRLGTPSEGEILLALEITPEPKLRWLKTVGVRVEKALDDQGQNLKQVPPAAGAPAGLPGAFGGGPGGAGGFPGGPLPGAGMVVGGAVNDQGRLTPLHLKKGAQATTSLKELSGSITAEVLLEPKPLITVTDFLQSGGKTIKGTNGGSIKIVAINQTGTGQVSVHFELDPPEGAALAGTPISISHSAEGIVLSNINAPDSPHQVLTLQDDKGNFLPLISVGIGSNPGKGTRYTLACQPQQGQGEPAKLVFAVSKSITLSVPFTLKNMPLPQARAER